MKNLAIKLVWFVTVYLVLFVILCATSFNDSGLLLLLAIGQFLILVMVYTVLNDNYKTPNSFEDWYDDYPKTSNK